MKKLIFSILPAFLFAFISCMNMSSGSGENGSVRIALPGSSRAAYNKDNADKFTVRLYNDNFDQTEEGSLGGVIEFGDLEPGKYTAEAEAWNTAENLLEGSGSAKITVKAGETTDCNIKMILEGIFYSKYMLYSDSDGNMYVYDYLTCTEKKKKEDSYNLAEDNSGNVYYMYVPEDSQGYYKTPQIKKFTDTDTDSYEYELNFSSYDTNFSYTRLFDAYYDSTTGIYWVAYANYSKNKLFLCKETNRYAEIGEDSADFPFSSACIATQGENFYYSFNSSNNTNQCPDSIGYATFDYTESGSGGSATKIKTKTLADFGFSGGTITDMAVLEDGTVAVLVRSAGVDSETECFRGNMWIDDKAVLYSRGALVLLASDLSKVQKILGWTESSRQIKAVGTNGEPNTVRTVTSKAAYIPEYAKRNSMFYGPVKIVAIRPKELVIADCGANFVLPDYDGKKNGKMYAHNRLMTVNLRNFAIGCKKEFSEDELKFQNLIISGGIEASSSGDWYGKYVDEK